MSFLVWIILGLVAGYIASQIVDRVGKGLWLNMGSESSARLSAG